MRYWAELGGHKLTNPPKETPQITKILNGIASFEYTIQNNTSNRAILAAHLTEDFVIKSRYGGSWFPLKFPVTFGGRILLTGSIDCDNIEYLSKHRIRLTGYASFVDLSYPIFKRLADADASNVDKVWDKDVAWIDYTTEANNDTINDVELSFLGEEGYCFYIGRDKTFSVIETKYSTKGVYDATVVWEYWNGAAWVTLDCLDQSRGFTQDADVGRFLIIPNKPADWTKTTVNEADERYWIRLRISACVSITTEPKLDRIRIGDTDVCRVEFNNIAANTILGYILEGTEYSDDVVDSCPSDLVSIRGEYESKLRWIAAIGKALTHGTDEKKPYDWWVTVSNKKYVHFKQQRGKTADISHIFPLTFPVLFGGSGYIDSELTMLNKREGYQGIANRIFGLGSFDGMDKRRAIVEDTASQDSYDLREIYLKDMRYSHESSLKELIQKELTDSKAPLKEVSCEITTKYWIEHDLEVGDEVVIHQPSWNVSNQVYRIMRAVIGYSRTRLDLGVSQMHLENIRSALQRQSDITDVWMAGATNLYSVQSYENADITHPLHLRFFLPPEIKYINHVYLNFKIKQYRAYTGQTPSGGGSTTPSGGGSTSGSGGSSTPTSGVTADSYLEAHYFISGYNGAAQFSLKSHKHSFSVPSVPHSGDTDAGDGAAVSFLQITSVEYKEWPNKNHTHTVTIPNHTHSTPNHTHSTPNHTHTMTYQIYEASESSPSITVKVGEDGGSLTEINDSPFTTDQTKLDITDLVQAIGTDKWIDIEFTPNQIRRIEANAYAQVFIESK